GDDRPAHGAEIEGEGTLGEPDRTDAADDVQPSTHHGRTARGARLGQPRQRTPADAVEGEHGSQPVTGPETAAVAARDVDPVAARGDERMVRRSRQGWQPPAPTRRR